MKIKTEHHVEKGIYFNKDDIGIGIKICSNKELIYGIKGRISGIAIDLLFLHMYFYIIRCDKKNTFKKANKNG